MIKINPKGLKDIRNQFRILMEEIEKDNLQIPHTNMLKILGSIENREQIILEEIFEVKDA